MTTSDGRTKRIIVSSLGAVAGTAVFNLVLSHFLLAEPGAVKILTTIFFVVCMLLIFFIERQSGNPEVGRILFRRKQYKAAIPVLEKAAAKKDEESSKLLGDIYFHGLDVEKNWEKAAQHYGRILALELALRYVIFSQRQFLEKNQAVARSMVAHLVPECLANMETMADAGQAQACLGVAVWYDDYLNPAAEKDLVKAAAYYSKAVAAGLKEAEGSLGRILIEEEGFNQEQATQGLALLEKDFNRGSLESGLMLARFYAKGGRHIAADLEKAKRIFAVLLERIVADQKRGELDDMAVELADLYNELGLSQELTDEQALALNPARSRYESCTHQEQ